MISKFTRNLYRAALFFLSFSFGNFSNAQICSKAQLPFNLQNGLVGYYPFCGNANDASGNNNNGTVNGATSKVDLIKSNVISF